MQLIIDLIWILCGGLLGGLAARLLKQPLIIGYIIAGVIIGPNTSGITVVSGDTLMSLADIGVALLLFSLGIEFSVRDLKPIGKIAVFGTIIQVVLTLIFCYALGRFLNWDPLPSFCLAVACVASSTAVILKTLASGHVTALSGRVMLGLSIVQDLMVFPLMIVLISLQDAGSGSITTTIMPIFTAVVFVLAMMIIGRRVIPAALRFVAHWQSQELFLFSVIAISLGIGYISHLFGLSLAFGAFVAGLVLAGSDYGHKALNEAIPPRDLFALVFFVSVGMLLEPSFVWENIGIISLLVVIVCVGRSLILSGLCWSFGYRNIVPIAVFTGMMPISEIGFIVIYQASAAGSNGPIIDNYVYSIILNMIVISMLLGPIVSGLTTFLYRLFGKALQKEVDHIDGKEIGIDQHVVVAGGWSLARDTARVLRFLKLPYIVIEPKHQLFTKLQREGLDVLFGDPSQPMILDKAALSKAGLLLITSGSHAEIVNITKAARAISPELRIVVQSKGHENSQELADLGVSEIVHSEYEAGFEMLRQALVSKDVSLLKTEHYLDEIRKMLYHKQRQWGD
ncbi:MAG: cation:proton antiporter [Syntrophobacterales bacterium]|jgi:CPA2 family monovalent cation:H+ antiporter-2|nr:cation:proton antiporter [Syntrophobacterales bacterium]